MFDTHFLNDEGKAVVKNFKTELAKGVKAALEYLPDGREKAIFLTKIEEAAFFGTKAIAMRPDMHTEKTEY